MTHENLFSSLIDELRVRNARAHASLLAPSSLMFRRWLEETLSSEPGAAEGLLATPVFEHKFGFKKSNLTMNDLVAQGTLHSGLVAQMDKPPKEFKGQAFRSHWSPYTHQVEAWNALQGEQPRSVVVSAGTGAGKTECFLIPILNDLAEQADKKRGVIEGVQALFLYPLNALINSQRERLSAWTRGFGGTVRYCLYNGETPDKVKKALQKETPERVRSRKLLRASPPPLLITNATMLEYMLVRPDDRPILERSRGKLKYIVIDEAHTYVGSMAAELALLLRRVMNAFEVDPQDVRFIATSATLSSGDAETARTDIQRFLADIAGQELARVQVVTDERAIPPLDTAPVADGFPSLEALQAAPPERRFALLAESTGPRALRQALVDGGAHTGDALHKLLEGDGLGLKSQDLVPLLDLGTRAKPAPTPAEPDPEAFLPLRGHLFVRGLEGLWACLNPECPGIAGTPLADARWPFGALHTARRSNCSHAGCGGRVLELALCQQCGTESLLSSIQEDEDGFEELRPLPYDSVADPQDERDDVETGDDTGDLGGDGEEVEERVDLSTARLVGARRAASMRSGEISPSVAIGIDGGVDVADGNPFSLISPAPDGRMQCPNCGHRDTDRRLHFRSCRTGRNFVLGVSVPVLLQHMPPADKPKDLPLEGRRTISFTDSRQGTARFAARSQGEAERNYVRSFIYHQLLAEQSGNPALLADVLRELEKQRKAQAAMIAAGLDGDLLSGSISALETKVESLASDQPVPARTIADRLAQTSSFGHLHQYWRDYLPFRETGIDKATLAHWLVLREFARRPMRRASLETLGLVAVQFPGLELTRKPPQQWRQWAQEHAQASWHALLKLLVDFYIRSNSAVEMDPAFFRWVGTTIRPKHVTGPGGDVVRNRRVSWPRLDVRTRPRLAWLIIRAFNLDAENPDVLQRVNDVLDSAYNYILPALKPSEDGHQLPMDRMELVPVMKAWRCPLTRMLLDTTLQGHSPYQPPLDRSFDTKCSEVRVPRAPEAFWHRGDPSQWLESDADVTVARASGALSEFAERVLEFSRYYQVAEHSAQLQTSALKTAEKQFREGRLNLLSCSTTMEMGVDIGNLSGVAMNNAPPSPANFLQRVGRAGRRGESAAVSVTVCRHLPHDQAVYAKPDWPFRTPMHITNVKLDSPRIVERHVRAAALTQFLIDTVPGEALLRLNCAWFFLVPEAQEQSVCERLLGWLVGEASTDHALHLKVERLVHESALHGVPARTLLADCVEAFNEARKRFLKVRDGIMQQIEELPETDRGESPAWYALDRQRRRLDEEYLLSVLADEQVLPGYGFPTGVVPLVTTTVEELKALKAADERAKKKREAGTGERPEDRDERIDARTRLMGFPTRDIAMALREYAPGANVVLERRTYSARGVTLNWHLPPDAGVGAVRDVQALRVYWQCPLCGATGTEPVDSPRVCPSCGHTKLQRSRYLEPAGFAVDLFEDAQMDAAPADYIPVEPPLVSSGTARLENIGRPALVRFRHASDGEVFHHNSGLHGHGYAVCLRCGRAEPETEAREDGIDGTMPSKMQNHFRLRGGKGSNWRDKEAGPRCEGNEGSWAIQRHLELGASTRTDVLEVRLVDPQSGLLVEDRTLLTTIAVALRKEAARALGVDERELGYQVVRRLQDGHRGRAVLLYDTASGGAGFCAELPPLLPELLRRTVQACDCPARCDRACHACLLSNDTQHDLKHIDRFALVDANGGPPTLLTKEFLDALELPGDLRVFGDETQVVWGDPFLAVVNHARRSSRPGAAVTIQLRVGGAGHSWDPVSWSGRALVRALSALEGVSVRLIVSDEGLEALDWQQRRQLASLVESEGVELRGGGGSAVAGPSIWAEIDADEVRAFASDGPLEFGHDWAGRTEESFHLSGPTAGLTATGSAISPASLVGPLKTGVEPIDLRPSAAGVAHQYGRRLLDSIEDQIPGLLSDLAELGEADRISYEDRYLNSPLAVHSLYRLVQALKGSGVIGTSTAGLVSTLEASNHRQPWRLGHNWASSLDQGQVLEGLFDDVGVSLQLLLVPSHDRQKLQHHRSLKLAWGAKELEIRFDAGFGYLRTVGQDRFPFDRKVEVQVGLLKMGAWTLSAVPGTSPLPAYLFR